MGLCVGKPPIKMKIGFPDGFCSHSKNSKNGKGRKQGR